MERVSVPGSEQLYARRALWPKLGLSAPNSARGFSGPSAPNGPNGPLHRDPPSCRSGRWRRRARHGASEARLESGGSDFCQFPSCGQGLLASRASWGRGIIGPGLGRIRQLWPEGPASAYLLRPMESGYSASCHCIAQVARLPLSMPSPALVACVTSGSRGHEGPETRCRNAARAVSSTFAQREG
eukprot:4460638-Alexandrium_andersonii.AAC.1